MMVSWLRKMDFKQKNCTVRKLRWRDEISPSNSRSFKELHVNNGLETSSLPIILTKRECAESTSPCQVSAHFKRTRGEDRSVSWWGLSDLIDVVSLVYFKDRCRYDHHYHTTSVSSSVLYLELIMCQTGRLEYKYCVVFVLIFSIFCTLLSDVE